MKGGLTLKDILQFPEETNEVEFKRLGGDDGGSVVGNILKAIVAMANTDGGVVILGVGDPEKTSAKGNDRVFGIEENKEKYDEVVRNLSKVIPPADVPIDEITAPNGKTVALLYVTKAHGSFHSIDDKVFVRLNKGNKKLTTHEVVPFSYAKGFISVGEELVDTVDFSLLDTSYYRAWVEHNDLDPDNKGVEQVLASKGLARRDEKTNALKPTRSAILLFAEYPTSLMDTKCAIRVAAYTTNEEVFGETPNFVSMPKIIQGPAIKVIQDAQEYVLQALSTGIENGVSGFRTKRNLPERAVKEGITNAVIHRDYHTKRDIEIKLFPDRVEIINPGLFPFNITKYNIGKERARGFRNDSLVKTLREFPEPPNFDMNEGVKAMRNEMHMHNLYLPSFITYPDLQYYVKLVLRNGERSGAWENVQAYLEKERFIDNTKAREITGVAAADDMSRMLAGWVAYGLLIKMSPTGSKKHTLYRLSSANIL